MMNTNSVQWRCFGNGLAMWVGATDTVGGLVARYLDHERGLLLHVNEIHDIVFLVQKLDLGSIDLDQAVRYVSTAAGMARYDIERTGYLLAAVPGRKYYLKRDMILEFHGSGYPEFQSDLVERYALVEGVDDNLQSMFDRGRTSSLILARLPAVVIRRDFPTLV